MSFEVSAEAYDRFMGRFSVPLASLFCRYAGADRGERILDVGCGPGALTAELLSREAVVSAVDPSVSFGAAIRERHPGVDVRMAVAEDLPFDDATFDRAISQLVVHFMTDPVAGLREMGRVTRSGGAVAACVWDLGSPGSPLAAFWAGVNRLDASVTDESWRPGTRKGQLGDLLRAAGLAEVEESTLTVPASFAGFEDWWEPYTLGVGPAGDYVRGLDQERRATLREECRSGLPDGPFTLQAHAWVGRGRRV